MTRGTARARPSQSTCVMHDLGPPHYLPRGSSGTLCNFPAGPWLLRAWKKPQLCLSKNSTVLMWILRTLISAVNPEALEKSVLKHLFLWLSFSPFNDCCAYLQADVILLDFRLFGTNLTYCTKLFFKGLWVFSPLQDSMFLNIGN